MFLFEDTCIVKKYHRTRLSSRVLNIICCVISIEDRKYLKMFLKTLRKIGIILFCREKFLDGLSMDKDCHKPQTQRILVINSQQ